MNNISIPIPNERIGTYRVINFIILLLNFFVFGVVFLKAGIKSIDFAAIAGMVINGIPAIYFWLNRKHFRTPFLQITFGLDAMIWLMIGSTSLGLLMFVFTFLSFAANRPLRINFSEEGISYPSFPVKKYSWREVEQVIFKDDIITIDLKNNRLIQATVDAEAAESIDAKEFNELCKIRIRLQKDRY